MEGGVRPVNGEDGKSIDVGATLRKRMASIILSISGLAVYLGLVMLATVVVSFFEIKSYMAGGTLSKLGSLIAMAIGGILTPVLFLRSKNTAIKSLMVALKPEVFPLTFRDVGILVGVGLTGNILINAAANLLRLDQESAVLTWLEMKRGGSLFEMILMFLLVVLLVPVVEEFVYRGVMYHALKREMPDALAMVITTAVFALFHKGVFVTVSTGLMGLLFLEVLRRYRTIYASVLVHLSFNLSSFVLMVYFIR